MGYWNAGIDGSSLHERPSGFIWGDEPADTLDIAIDEIVDTFRRDWNRNPTRQEMIGGFMFSLCSESEKEWDALLSESKPWTPIGSPHANTSVTGMLNAIPKPRDN